MGDGLKIFKDKRHRSSSSIAGAVVEGTRSERKLDILNASIPEIDDQFAVAEARCDELQEKIDLVKVLKRKKKLKKRSMTKVTEVTPVENIPFISVRTQPKKKVSQQAARLRRVEVPPNPTRGYLDPATVEQHRMIGQVRGYNQNYTQPQNRDLDQRSLKLHSRRYADGDGTCGHVIRAASGGVTEVACGQDEINGKYSDNEMDRDEYVVPNNQSDVYRYNKSTNRPKNVSREGIKNVSRWTNDSEDIPKGGYRAVSSPVYRRRQTMVKPNTATMATVQQQADERPVVELFNKSHKPSGSPELKKPPPPAKTRNSPTDKRFRKQRQPQEFDDLVTGNLENSSPVHSKKDSNPFWHPHTRRVKYRSRRYELPTVASQMKQSGLRYYQTAANYTATHNIPFVVSKSTAPSHNIGVNIQQVLNGMKIQQPLSGIPLTIAHHMGLGHITHGAKSATVQELSLDTREMNAIKLGRRLVRLPSYKFMSYSRLLSLYREGDGMVPRFLRAITRPHYFYTSMYNLATNREDLDGATSKGRGGNEARQSLTEYATLYREYEQIENCIKEGNNDLELARRKEQLSKELAAREEHIRKVVQEYRNVGETEPLNLRASASTAEEYRPSTYKLNMATE